MFERIQYLQELLEKEASGNAYYTDYPPKNIDMKKSAESKGKAKDTNAARDEAQKMKKLYDDLMSQQKKQYED